MKNYERIHELIPVEALASLYYCDNDLILCKVCIYKDKCEEYHKKLTEYDERKATEWEYEKLETEYAHDCEQGIIDFLNAEVEK